MADEIAIDLTELPDEAKDRILGALVAHYDRELGLEMAAILRGWADQTEQYERDGSINPRGRRSPAEYRRLADAIDEHRAHLESAR